MTDLTWRPMTTGDVPALLTLVQACDAADGAPYVHDLARLDEEVGVTITDWEPEHDEEARLLKNATFRDHWLSTPTSAEAWERSLAASSTRRDLGLIANGPDGVMVGLCEVAHWPQDADPLGMDAAWIATLGTDVAWRGRGVASPTGANRLYADLGFEQHTSSVVHLRRLN